MATVDASDRWQVRCAQILKGHGFVPGLSNPALIAQVERNVKWLGHGDDFMVAMPTHEKFWFESVMFPKYNPDGIISIQMATLQWNLVSSGRAELRADTRHVAMVLGGLGLEKSSSVVTPVAKRPKSEELLLLAGAKSLTAEDTTLYRSVSGPLRLVICGRLSGARDETSHDHRLRETQTCWTLLVRATSSSN